MPITSDRMLFVLDIADQAVEKSEIARKALDAILNDVGSLQYQLNKLELNDETVDELIHSLTTLARDTRLACTIDAKIVKHLGEQQNHFLENQAKHKNAAARMRMLRAGIRKVPEHPRTKKSDSQRLNVEQQMQEDLEEMRRTGMERHPNQGPCNMDLGGQCSHCAEWSKKQYTEEDQAPVNQLKTMEDWERWQKFNREEDTKEALGKAARSEQIPTQDDHDSWLPRTKDTLP